MSSILTANMAMTGDPTDFSWITPELLLLGLVTVAVTALAAAVAEYRARRSHDYEPEVVDKITEVFRTGKTVEGWRCEGCLRWNWNPKAPSCQHCGSGMC